MHRENKIIPRLRLHNKIEADKIANRVVYAALGAARSLDSFAKARSLDHFSGFDHVTLVYLIKCHGGYFYEEKNFLRRTKFASCDVRD